MCGCIVGVVGLPRQRAGRPHRSRAAATVISVPQFVCADCGDPPSGPTCQELFETLLALDHSRQVPWGQLHGEAVACYFLQHPRAERAPRDVDPLRAMLQRFLESTDARLLPDDVCTIRDLAVDGSFPADGYRDRLAGWAASLLSDRGPAW